MRPGQDDFLLTRNELNRLFVELSSRSYRLIGPTLRDQAIIYDEIASDADLPIGWTDEQGPGHYRLKRRADEACFGYAVGPFSWRKSFQVPREKIWDADRNGTGFTVRPVEPRGEKLALIGVRACEIQGIHVQDLVFRDGPVQDPFYTERRKNVFIVAVQCAVAGGTCFCASMNAGPEVTRGFDLSLTEILDEDGHYFVVRPGSSAGDDVVDALGLERAAVPARQKAEDTVERTRRNMGRTLDNEGITELLYRNQESPRWDDVAERCLSCANCTLVCPTCFCSTVEDVTDLSGEHAERWRRWDSCFTTGHTELHGGSVRPDTRSQYRQWLTHKVGSWWDQFGVSGCVGCGRCITWCPVGIDLTEEVAAIRRIEGERE